jgi:hypothetical protein
VPTSGVLVGLGVLMPVLAVVMGAGGFGRGVAALGACTRPYLQGRTDAKSDSDPSVLFCEQAFPQVSACFIGSRLCL